MNLRYPAAAVAAALALLIGTGWSHAKGVLTRTYDPAPPDAAYETVWAETPTTVTLRYGGDAEPAVRLPTLVRFRDDDGHGPTTVTAELRRAAPGKWQGTFVLPHPGRWEGHHQHGPPFALRVLPPAEKPSRSWGALSMAVVGLLGVAALVRRHR